jgi:hypothetical protein
VKAKKRAGQKCPAHSNWPNLENKLQGKLNQAWVGVAIVRRDFAETIISRASVGTVEAGPRNTKLRVIKQVEEFGSELDPESFGNLRPFEDSEIKVVDSGSAQ